MYFEEVYEENEGAGKSIGKMALAALIFAAGAGKFGSDHCHAAQIDCLDLSACACHDHVLHLLAARRVR